LRLRGFFAFFISPPTQELVLISQKQKKEAIKLREDK